MNPRNPFLAFCGACLAIPLVLHRRPPPSRKTISATRQQGDRRDEGGKMGGGARLNTQAVERFGKNADDLVRPALR
jgi:hypothetical protein